MARSLSGQPPLLAEPVVGEDQCFLRQRPAVAHRFVNGYTLDQVAGSDGVQQFVAADCGDAVAALLLTFHPAIGVKPAQSLANGANADIVALAQCIKLQANSRLKSNFMLRPVPQQLPR